MTQFIAFIVGILFALIETIYIMPFRDGDSFSGSEPPVTNSAPSRGPASVPTAPQPRLNLPSAQAPDFSFDAPMAAPPAPEPSIILSETPFANDETHRIRSIYIATNRAMNPGFDPAEPATAVTEDLGPLRYLTADISIPREHRLGNLESQMWISSLFFAPNIERHVILQRVDMMDRNAALALISAELAATNDAILMYVHGFNTSFKTAARRAGQLSYDLSWDGPSVLFSWPSQDEALDYFVDSTLAEDSIPAMKQTMRDLAELDADRIIIVAHSMGTRIVSNAIKEMSLSGDPALDEISMVVLAAPDINRTTFIEQIAPRFREEAALVTLYASADDSALKLSKRANGFRRIGDTTDGVTIVEGIDVIDATGVKSNFFSHTYFGDNDSILTDIREMVRDSVGPAERSRLLAVPPDALTPDAITHWMVRPVRTGR